MILAQPKPAPVSPAAATTSTHWDPIVTALRGELEEYGGLIQLFDEQQRKLFANDAGAVAELVPKLEEQAGTARARRSARESLVRSFAAGRGRAGVSTLRQLLPDFPAEVRPLLEALIDEINHLVHRTRQRSRQNQMMLARLVELHQNLVPTLRPRAFTKTYTRGGMVSVTTTGLGPTYRATG